MRSINIFLTNAISMTFLNQINITNFKYFAFYLVRGSNTYMDRRFRGKVSGKRKEKEEKSK